MGQEPAEIRQEIERTRDEMGSTVDALGHKADVPGRIKESFADKRDRLRNQMAGASSTVSGATPDASDMRDGAKQAVGIAQENPLGLAIGGLAAGFLVGLALPTTQVEDERIGPLADDVKSKVRETGQEALESGKQVAQQAASAASEAASDAASEQGEQLRDSAQEKAQDLRGEEGGQAPGGSTATAGAPATPPPSVG